MVGDGAHDVALGKHADDGIALGANHILDHQCADLLPMEKFYGGLHGFVHADRGDTRTLSAKDLFHLHDILPKHERLDFGGVTVPGIQYAS